MTTRKKPGTTPPPSFHQGYRQQLRELQQLALFAIQTVDSVDLTTPNSAEKAYELIFSPTCSRRIHTLLKELGISCTFNDPDSSYLADIQAYASDLEFTLIPKLNTLLTQ